MEEIRKDIDEIIIASFSGEANSDDLNFLRDWLNHSPENQQTFEKLRQFWFHSRSGFTVANQDKQFEKLLNELPDNHLHNISRRDIPMRWAAVILLVMSFGLAYWMVESKVQETSEVLTFEKIVKQNPAGQKSQITLPDSSKVWLNAKSTLSYFVPFSQNRKLFLEGEAYFEVAHDPDNPFVVTTGNISTEALGTAFNIKTTERNVQIDLIQGKVKIANQNDSLDDSILLHPGEGVYYEEQRNLITRHKTELEEVVYWKENILYFKRASFQEVIDELEKWYGVEFIIAHNIDRQWVFTGRFENESLKNVLLAVSFAKKIDFAIKDKKVYVSPQN